MAQTELLEKFAEMAFHKIESGKCIIILGPDVVVENSSKTANEKLKEYLEEKGIDEIKYFYDKDEFFSFSEDETFFTNLNIRKFYEQLTATEILRKIAAIPFHLIITLSPDKILCKVLEEGGFNPNFDFFDKSQKHDSFPKPTKEKPLIYNLFGSYDVEESLVLTYNDLFDYLFAVYKKFELPNTLKDELKNDSYLILFVGLHFEKWYFKLLLRILNCHEPKRNFGSEKDRNMNIQLQNFYAEEFKTKFLQFTSSDIINSIYKKFEEQNKLRRKAGVVFISYAWGGESENIVGMLQNALNNQGISTIRDKTDLEFKGSIPEFMKKLGEAEVVVVVISDKYLKSPYCMSELVGMYNNKDFKNRIFPIILDDAKIFQPAERLCYMEFWKSKKTELEEAINRIGDEAVKVISEDFTTFEGILNLFGDVINDLKNFNALTPEIHRNENFASLIIEILKQLDKTKI